MFVRACIMNAKISEGPACYTHTQCKTENRFPICHPVTPTLVCVRGTVTVRIEHTIHNNNNNARRQRCYSTDTHIVFLYGRRTHSHYTTDGYVCVRVCTPIYVYNTILAPHGIQFVYCTAYVK